MKCLTFYVSKLELCKSQLSEADLTTAVRKLGKSNFVSKAEVIPQSENLTYCVAIWFAERDIDKISSVLPSLRTVLSSKVTKQLQVTITNDWKASLWRLG